MHPLRHSTVYHSNHLRHLSSHVRPSIFPCKTQSRFHRAWLLSIIVPISKHGGQALPEDAPSSAERKHLPSEKTRASFGGASALLPLTVLLCLPHLLLGVSDVIFGVLNALCGGLFEAFGGPPWQDTSEELGTDMLEDPASELPISLVDDEDMGRKLEGLVKASAPLVSLGILACALSLTLDAGILLGNVNSAVRAMERSRWYMAAKAFMGMAPHLYVYASAIRQSSTNPRPHNHVSKPSSKPSFHTGSTADDASPPSKGASSQQPAESLGCEGTGSNSPRQSKQTLTSIAPSTDAMLRLACCFMLCTSLTLPVTISSLCPPALRFAMHALVFGQAMIALVLFKQALSKNAHTFFFDNCPVMLNQVCLLAFGKAIVVCAQWAQVDGMLHLNDPLASFFIGWAPLLSVTVSWMSLQNLVPFLSFGLGMLFHVVCDVKDKVKSLAPKLGYK